MIMKNTPTATKQYLPYFFFIAGDEVAGVVVVGIDIGVVLVVVVVVFIFLTIDRNLELGYCEELKQIRLSVKRNTCAR